MKVNKIISVIILIFVLIVFRIYSTGRDSSEVYKIKFGEKVTFFVATDIHFLAENLTDGGGLSDFYLRNYEGLREVGTQDIRNSQNLYPLYSLFQKNFYVLLIPCSNHHLRKTDSRLSPVLFFTNKRI